MTSKEPTKEQLKEFWEWCGFRKVYIQALLDSPYSDEKGKFILIPPDKDWANSTRCDMDINLNNLFKYAVPKVIQSYQRAWSDGKPLNVSVETQICWCSPTVHREAYWSCNFTRPSLLEHGHTEVLNYAEGTTPALALFWAIWEVINEIKGMK